VNFGRSVVTNWNLTHSFVEVREPIELSFGVVSGVCGRLRHWFNLVTTSRRTLCCHYSTSFIMLWYLYCYTAKLQKI